MSHTEGQVNQSSNISVSIRVIGRVGVLSYMPEIVFQSTDM